MRLSACSVLSDPPALEGAVLRVNLRAWLGGRPLIAALATRKTRRRLSNRVLILSNHECKHVSCCMSISPLCFVGSSSSEYESVSEPPSPNPALVGAVLRVNLRAWLGGRPLIAALATRKTRRRLENRVLILSNHECKHVSWLYVYLTALSCWLAVVRVRVRGPNIWGHRSRLASDFESRAPPSRCTQKGKTDYRTVCLHIVKSRIYLTTAFFLHFVRVSVVLDWCWLRSFSTFFA